jgi:hypothetical protein
MLKSSYVHHIDKKTYMTTIRVIQKKLYTWKNSCSIREWVRLTLAFLYICAFTRN